MMMELLAAEIKQVGRNSLKTAAKSYEITRNNNLRI